MKYISIIILLFTIIGCKSNEAVEYEKEYLSNVGDIVFDKDIDDPDFKLCSKIPTVLQYFNTSDGPRYIGTKSAIIDLFEREYKPVANNQSGRIRIRFVVNCEGKAGFYRMIQADNEYKPIKFDNKITDQLLTITKGIEQWPVQYYGDDKPVGSEYYHVATDYYYYLIFIIENGHVKQILP